MNILLVGCWIRPYRRIVIERDRRLAPFLSFSSSGCDYYHGEQLHTVGLFVMANVIRANKGAFVELYSAAILLSLPVFWFPLLYFLFLLWCPSVLLTLCVFRQCVLIKFIPLWLCLLLLLWCDSRHTGGQPGTSFLLVSFILLRLRKAISLLFLEYQLKSAACGSVWRRMREDYKEPVLNSLNIILSFRLIERFN